MAKATLKEMEALALSYVASNKIAQFPFTATADDVSGLVEKIALTFTNDSDFIDKLQELDGVNLPFGDGVEEWQQDLILPTSYDSAGSNALAPSRPTYRNPSYSYSLGRKTIKITIDNYKYQRTFHNEAEYVSFVMEITKRLFDSESVFKYDVKRELLGKYADACISTLAPTKTFATATAYSVGEYLKSKASDYAVGVVMTAIPASNADAWATLVSAGKIVILNDLAEVVAIPTDDSTGEAFIKKVKGLVEIAKDINEGYTLNGNPNVANEMVLYIKQGVMPSLEVDTMAGAFHLDKISIPADLKVIKDFGTTGETDHVYAILMDKRGARLFEKYRAVRTQENADGDFINYVLHTDRVAHYSKNTFIKVFKSA